VLETINLSLAKRKTKNKLPPIVDLKYFLKHKDKSFKVLCNFFKQVQNEKGISIIAIRSDHGGEFENDNF